MKRAFSRLEFASWSPPLLLGMVVILAYGLMVRRVGFYWDDWPLLLEIKRVGPSGYVEMVGGQQRSLLAVFYRMTSAVFGDHPLRWQAFALLVRWSTAVAVWGMARALWPERKRDAVAIALLFAVYPGYVDHYIALTYSHIFLVYALYILSLYMMIEAVKRKSWLLGAASLLATAVVYFSHDYYTGLEIARPLMIWYVLELREEGDVRKILAYWGPYLALFMGVVFWKMFGVTDKMYEPALLRSLSEDFRGTIGVWSKAALQDMVKAVVVAWKNAITPLRLVSFDFDIEWQYSVVVIVVAGLVWGYLRQMSKTDDQPGRESAADEHAVAKQYVALGGLMLIGARLPYWIVPFYVQLHFPEDRFTIPMMLGISFFVFGLLVWMIKPRWEIVVLASFVAFGAGQQFWSGNDFVLEWQDQERFFRQFVWRIPSLNPGTAILTDKLPFPYSDDEAVTAVLNLLYTPEASAADLSYGFFDLSSALGKEIQKLESGVPITKSYGKLRFDGSTSQAIVVSYASDQCLRVLSPRDYNLAQVPASLLFEAISLSDIDSIHSTSIVQPQALDNWYGYDPHKGWCYYFEKADLARQHGNWEEVARLGDDVTSLGLKYFVPDELFPFIEGYAMSGNFERAVRLTEEVKSVSPYYLPHLCQIWIRIGDQARLDAAGEIALTDVLSSLDCR